MLTGGLTAVPTAGRRGAAPDVPVAASTAVLPLLRDDAVCTVLGAFPAAVYVGHPSGDVLAVVATDGLRLPNALVRAAPSRQAPLAPVGSAAVREGALLLDGVPHRPVRAWTPRGRTPGTLRAAAVDELAARLGPPPHTGELARRLQAAGVRLADALRTGDGLRGAAGALLGLGPGLTPAGDDLLAGALVTVAHLGPGPALRPGDVRPDATTALSADLLRHAAAGRAAPPVLAVLDALVGARPIAAALAGLLAVGSTSGHDTATGVLLAARVLRDPPEDP